MLHQIVICVKSCVRGKIVGKIRENLFGNVFELFLWPEMISKNRSLMALLRILGAIFYNCPQLARPPAPLVNDLLFELNEEDPKKHDDEKKSPISATTTTTTMMGRGEKKRETNFMCVNSIKINFALIRT